MRLQKKIIRIMTGEHYLAHTDELFSQLEILKVEDIYKFFILQYVNSHFDCFVIRVVRYPIRDSYEIVPSSMSMPACGRGAIVSACADLTNQWQCCWVDPACAWK